jgi:nucleoid-associated protein YgaU
MALQEKYAELISAANAAGVANLLVREQDNVLYINGDAPSAAAKTDLWAIYEKLDPEFRSADVVMNLTAPELEAIEYTVQPGDSLSKIGKNFNKPWREIYEANKDVIGSNPDYIQVGWKLKI